MRVDRSIIVIGAFLGILGAALAWNGYGFVQVERGWSELIAGTTIFSSGLVLVALGFILRALMAIASSADKAALLLAKGKNPLAAPAGSETPFAAPPANPYAAPPLPPASAPPPAPALAPVAAPVAAAPAEASRQAPQKVDLDAIEAVEAALAQEMPPRPTAAFGDSLVNALSPVKRPSVALPAAPAAAPASGPLSWMIRPPKVRVEPDKAVPPPVAFSPEPPEPEAAIPEAAIPESEDSGLEETSFQPTSPREGAPNAPVAHLPAPPREAEASEVEWLDKAMAEADPFFHPGSTAATPVTAQEAVFPDALPESAAEPVNASAEAPSPDERHPDDLWSPSAANPEPPRPAPQPEPHLPQQDAAESADDQPRGEIIGHYEAHGAHYTMYADGSIDAETAHGSYRFASMDDLKRFIEGEQ